jgi:hypothetical protein
MLKELFVRDVGIDLARAVVFVREHLKIVGIARLAELPAVDYLSASAHETLRKILATEARRRASGRVSTRWRSLLSNEPRSDSLWEAFVVHLVSIVE